MDRKLMIFGSVALGGLALAWAANREKAAAAAAADPDSQPNPDDERARPQLPASFPDAPAPAPNPPPSGPRIEVGPVSPDLPQPSLPAPVVLPPVIVQPPPSSSSSAPPIMPPPSSSAPPTLPTKRPFGDQPLDVEADAGNTAIPAAPTPAAKRTAQQAAADLLEYVTPILRAKRGSDLGVKGAPNSLVKAAQIDMGVKPDGIYGPETRTKGKALLGVTFPART